MVSGLCDLLARSAMQAPDRTALVDGPRRFTYERLWAHVNAFASFLLTEGLQPGERVAIILPNSVDYVVALYGTMLAGGVATPLSAVARRHELGIWLDHSQAEWAVHAEGDCEALAAGQSLGRRIRSIVADGASETGAASFAGVPQARGRVEPRRRPPNLPACIVYTSGTTGNPKGVMLGDGNLTSNAAAIAEYLSLTALDVGLGLLPFSYSYGSSVLNSHLAAAATIVIARSFAYPQLVAELIVRERITGFAGVASTFSLLLSRLRLEDYDLSSLRYLTQAGGRMPGPLLERLQEAFPRQLVYLMYGQTEATARLTYLPPHLLATRPNSAGMPIPGVRIEIRDESGSAVPANTPGEIWANGPNVMLGYWRDECATSAVLRHGWLKTGDIGHLDSEGFLYLHGRRSDIIKVGEHSVYPQDVEDAIAALPGVQAAAAVGVHDELLGQAIVAFVVANGGMRPDPHAIRTHCRRMLAPYKVPSRVEFLDALPTNASGKVLRRVLSEMGGATPP